MYLQHTATHRNTLQHTATHVYISSLGVAGDMYLQHTATHCNTLQHTITNHNAQQYTAKH